MKSVKCECRIYTDKLNTHAHSFAQLILPLHGRLHIETDLKKLVLDDEHLFFLPPECEHAFKATKSNEFLVLDIPHYMVTKYDMEMIQGGNELSFDERWKAVRYLLLNEVQNKNSPYAINNLFHIFYHFITDENVAPSVKYINEHFTEDIGLKTLADIEHYNASYYCEWFKKNMKVSPIEYIQSLRVKEAKELLLYTDYTILQIAQMVGYKHNSSLTKAFKSLEKTTPKEFRSNNRK